MLSRCSLFLFPCYFSLLGLHDDSINTMYYLLSDWHFVILYFVIVIVSCVAIVMIMMIVYAIGN